MGRQEYQTDQGVSKLQDQRVSKQVPKYLKDQGVSKLKNKKWRRKEKSLKYAKNHEDYDCYYFGHSENHWRRKEKSL